MTTIVISGQRVCKNLHLELPHYIIKKSSFLKPKSRRYKTNKQQHNIIRKCDTCTKPKNR